MAHLVDVHVGQKLRNRRWMMGLTQEQLAQLVGVRFQQIQKYEGGVNRVSASRLWDLSQALGVSVSFFFEGLEGSATKTPQHEASPGASIMEQKETIELVRSFYGMDKDARRCMLELMKSLTSHQDDKAA